MGEMADNIGISQSTDEKTIKKLRKNISSREWGRQKQDNGK
jgi:hypothetical protein